jgi:hypothetical protein
VLQRAEPELERAPQRQIGRSALRAALRVKRGDDFTEVRLERRPQRARRGGVRGTEAHEPPRQLAAHLPAAPAGAGRRRRLRLRREGAQDEREDDGAIPVQVGLHVSHLCGVGSTKE